jgi:hypothetical protein
MIYLISTLSINSEPTILSQYSIEKKSEHSQKIGFSESNILSQTPIINDDPEIDEENSEPLNFIENSELNILFQNSITDNNPESTNIAKIS